MIYYIDEFLKTDYNVYAQKKTCWQRCSPFLLDKGVISLLVTLAFMLTGVICLVLSRHMYDLSPSHGFDQVSRYILSMGIFGFLSGLANVLAIVLLFCRIPLEFGSG